MSVAVAVVATLLAALGALNLLLVLRLSSIVRERLNAPAAAPAGPGSPQVGSKMPDFHALTTAGVERAGHDMRVGPALIGFFAPGCRPCHENIPDFLVQSAELAHAGGSSVAFVLGSAARSDLEEAVRDLEGCDIVVIDPADESVLDLFEVHKFPCFLKYESDELLWWSPTLAANLIPSHA